MSRTITDADLHRWEAYTSSGPFGLPDKPKLVFNCLTDPSRRPRWAVFEGDNADAERALQAMDQAELQRVLENSAQLR